MLYTISAPADTHERIRLFPSLEAALAKRSEGECVRIVAVDFDVQMRRVIPVWTDPHLFDPCWSTPAQPHPDGSVTAKGPIPTQLFMS